MNILVLNAGSSSLKYQFIDITSESVLAAGTIERIGEEGEAPFTHEEIGKEEVVRYIHIPDHAVAISLVIDAIHHDATSEHPELGTIDGVGHRVVHGGTFFSESALLDDENIEKIRICSSLAPLHNPPAVEVIEYSRQILSDIPHVAVFDTAFHATIPAKAHRYSLPADLVEKFAIRKYGFHGTSHRYVAIAAKKFLGQMPERMVSLHIGNGCSLTAIRDGVSVDTTMGFTPLAGIMMGTRCGDIDPAIVPYVIENTDITAAEMERIMNRKSGLLGASGVSNDFRTVLEAAEAGNNACHEALEMYCYVSRRHMGAMILAMGGVDTIAFTAGVGQNSDYYRAKVLEGLEYMGIELDAEKNATRAKGVRDISVEGSPTRILVVPANEELMIARDVVEIMNA